MKTLTSRFLTLILRHKPSVIGLTLDKNGWIKVPDLIDGCAKHKTFVDINLLKKLVAECPKQRFSFNEQGDAIRANQGHSIPIDLELTEQVPPDILYHGTVEASLDLIFSSGIKKMNRQYVHLSSDLNTASIVGARRGHPVILKIKSKELYRNGYKFFVSDNNVWLTDYVPPWALELN
jgi:putative RNA 2'-phosphotransferase